MDEYISREALIKAVEDFRDNDPWKKKRTMWEKWRRRNYCEIALKGLKKAPAADVRPVVRGEWRKSELFNDQPECPVCFYVAAKTNFCPNCGADMRGGTP